MAHFAHYIKRHLEISKEPGTSSTAPYIEVQLEGQGFNRPEFHSVPFNSGVGSRVKKDDTIWLFSQLRTPWGVLPPSLDGRIEVAKVELTEQNPKRRRFEATDESRWYPLFDAVRLTKELEAVDAHGGVRPLLNSPTTAIGQALQFLREIANPAPLLRHSEYVKDSPLDFISYRIVDGTESAFVLAKSLLKGNKAVFWDRWSLPRRLSERREKVGVEALETHVIEAIQRSENVWGVMSSLYGADGSFSRLEKNLAIRLNLFRPFLQTTK